MDIKIAGITEEIMRVALAQANEGRAHILGEMAKALDHTREELSSHAPRIETMSVPKDKIRDSHRHRRQDHSRDRRHHRREGRHRRRRHGQASASSDPEKIEAARKWIQGITMEAEVGKIYDGKVVNIVDFGAFVNFMGGKDGLVHVSEISNERVASAEGRPVTEGQEVKVKVLEIDARGKVRLSMRVVDQETGEELPDTRPPREGGDRPDRGPRGDRDGGGRGGDREGGRGPRRDGERGPRRDGDRDRGPRREGGERSERGPRRDRPEGTSDDGPAPEFAPAFLTRTDD